jgi:hypothetical protein
MGGACDSHPPPIPDSLFFLLDNLSPGKTISPAGGVYDLPDLRWEQDNQAITDFMRSQVVQPGAYIHRS